MMFLKTSNSNGQPGEDVMKKIKKTSSPSKNNATRTLIASLIGFFMITLDAVIVNVALPEMGRDLHTGISGLQWIVDGYTLMFAALLLSAGVFSDRVGAGRAFKNGLIVFGIASTACGFAPNLGFMVIARFLQGSAAAVMMPSSMALISYAYPDKVKRARAIAIWALGGSIASSSGPVLGGILSEWDWRLIFFINVPTAIAALWILRHAPQSSHKKEVFDWTGQITAILAMGALTYGVIEAGSIGLKAPVVIVSLVVAFISLIIFVLAQRSGKHPMVPASLFQSRNTFISNVIGFTFMVGYYGLPFVMSLYLQQERGFSPLTTGAFFLPMMLIGAILTPFSARLAEKLGNKLLIALGLIAMALGLAAIALAPSSTPVWVLSALMVLVGIGGPFVSPPITAVLLNSVSTRQAGVASGVFNTSRQVGGALAVAVFGALLAQPGMFLQGVRNSLLLAAGVTLITMIIGLRLQSTPKNYAAVD